MEVGRGRDGEMEGGRSSFVGTQRERLRRGGEGGGT